MKGIVLAGGSGTRLYPATLAVSKQLLPIYDKPMIYYPLSILMLADIRDILVISTPYDLPAFKRLLGDGSQWGVRLCYKEQPEPEGLAQAFTIGEDFIGNDSSCLILGDNIFHGHQLTPVLTSAARIDKGALIFAHHVQDPHRYGVIEFDGNGVPLSIEEKPENPKSNFAIPGLYFYGPGVTEEVRELRPSKRGELEITDLNLRYLARGELKVVQFGRGVAWLDSGTHRSFMEASSFVQVMEDRQQLKIACLEEIAFNKGWISQSCVEETIEKYGNTPYSKYLKNLLK